MEPLSSDVYPLPSGPSRAQLISCVAVDRPDGSIPRQSIYDGYICAGDHYGGAWIRGTLESHVSSSNESDSLPARALAGVAHT